MRSAAHVLGIETSHYAGGRYGTRIFGIFDVSLPLIYGEGAMKAFPRLQRHILSQRRDDTILFWTTGEIEPRGMLAKSPSESSQSSDIRQRPSSDT